MNEYQVDDIKSYVVLANSEEEALEKFWAGEWESDSDPDQVVTQLGGDDDN